VVSGRESETFGVKFVREIGDREIEENGELIGRDERGGINFGMENGERSGINKEFFVRNNSK
jgi:hypothetical protein